MTGATRLLRQLGRVRILLVLLAIYAGFSVLSPAAFLTWDNLISIALAASGVLVLAVGMTVLVVAGQLDLSVGSQLVLSAVLSAAIMNALTDRPLAVVLVAGIVTALLAGAAFGLVNALAVNRLRVPSLIVTLGSLSAGLGLAQLLTAAGGSTSYPAPTALTDFGLSRVVGIPSVVLVSLSVALVVGIVLARTRFGLYCAAVGSNKEAARRVGIPVDRVVLRAFLLMGALAGIGGLLDLARFSSVSVATHLYGGRGHVFGTVVGTLIPIVLLQGFVILNVNPSWQNVAIGAVLVAAVGFDQFDRTSRRARAEARAADADEAELTTSTRARIQPETERVQP